MSATEPLIHVYVASSTTDTMNFIAGNDDPHTIEVRISADSPFSLGEEVLQAVRQRISKSYSSHLI